MSLLLVLGPDFGSPPSFMRRKLLTLLGDCGKTSSFIDDVSIVKRYASESSHAIPVCSDDEALLKARKEVRLRYIAFLVYLLLSKLAYQLRTFICCGRSRMTVFTLSGHSFQN